MLFSYFSISGGLYGVVWTEMFPLFELHLRELLLHTTANKLYSGVLDTNEF